MNRTLYALIISLGMSSIAAASSGACSGHDGVNCLIGPDSDGSVICNDHWQGSSVQYSTIKDVCGSEYTELLFNDVAKYTPYYESIKFLKENGIVDGYSDGFFRPNENINRAEFTKILIGAMRSYFPDDYPSDSQLATNVPIDGCFPDASKEQWFSKYVCHAKKIGFIDGYPDGTFGPGNNINVVEAMKIVFEARDYSGIDHNDQGIWYNKYTEYADENKLWVDKWLTVGPEYSITRGEMADFIHKSVFRQ